MGFFKSIRDRRLFQIVAGYAAAGWVVLEVADQLIQNEILPPFAYGVVLLWYIGGFMAALVIGWYHGERGDQKAPISEIVILSVLCLTLLGFSGARVSGFLSDRAALAAAEAGELDRSRIAVRYFTDRSPDGANQHIADALTEDLIQVLSRVRALDVVSANGVAPFRELEIPVDSMARALRTGTVVDGDVEQVGDELQINLRLVEGNSGAEFRRTTLRPNVEDVLAARETVAEQASLFLRELLGEEIELRERERSTESVAAWSLVQQAERERKQAEQQLHEDDVETAFASFDRADELLAQAEELDASWPEPAVVRARIAYRRSRLAHEPQDAVPWIQRGIEFADRALRLRPSHAPALEMRGTLRYWWHLLPVVPDPAERQRLFDLARADLEEAVRQDPTLASAHATLSHLYFWVDDISSGVLAAQRAYEEDAYLETADLVLWRLVGGTYDLEAFDRTKRWCDEGARRFPQDYRFAQCGLLVMTTRAGEPDAELGWRLVARVDSLAPEPVRVVQHAKSLIYLGGALARAELRDSANAVLLAARQQFRPELDPGRELFLNEAAMRASVLGDVEGAIDLLKQYAAARPDYTFDHHWWWRDVRRHPRYSELQVFQTSH